jgi:hypothetical protein
MILNNRARKWLLLGGASLLLAAPAIVRSAPESILPPGFGEPDPPKAPSKPSPSKSSGADLKLPTDLLPDDAEPTSGSRPTSGSSASVSSGSSKPVSGKEAEGDEEEEGDEEIPILVDLPPSARRSLDQVGVLGMDDGDMGAQAFGVADGRYLNTLLRNIDAPIVSRWSSIVLRRALLSRSVTPPNVNGADWVAERSWLLLRMGEADSARLLVQSVDTDRFTPRLFEVGMQSALANADPASVCGMVDGALVESKEKAWKMSRAICLALSGEAPQATAQIDSMRDRGEVKGVDILLAEKVIGAGGNSRRSVKIEWENVLGLTAWRYGLSTATAVPIPEKLMQSVGVHVRAWQAKAPLLSFSERQRGADVAAAMGVYSSAALVDHYSSMIDADDVSEGVSKTGENLQRAFVGKSAEDKVAAMRALWTAEKLDRYAQYARLIMTARAAAMLPVNDAVSADVDNLVFSMLTAGYDTRAAQWAGVASNAGGAAGDRAMAILAVGSPTPLKTFDSGDVSGFDGKSDNAARLLFAGMAGLGRLSAADIESMAEDMEVPIGRSTPWTRAIDRAIVAKETGTVAVLAAAALQTTDWAKVRPEYFYRAILGLKQVGLEAEARMIAAEAVARS